MAGVPSWAIRTQIRNTDLAASAALEDLAADRHVCVRCEENNRTILVGHSECEDFGHEGTDLSRRKVHDRDDESADQILRLISIGELRGRVSLPDVGPEIHHELVRGFARFREDVRPDDTANPHFDFREI